MVLCIYVQGIKSITGGGPVNETLVYILYLYQNSFKYYEMGYGSAMAWILLVIVGFFTAMVFRSSKQWVFYEIIQIWHLKRRRG